MGYQISAQELASKQSTKPLLTTQFHTTINSFTSSFSSGAKSLFSNSNSVDPMVPFKQAFNLINLNIPKDTKVLAAIETPGLLDMRRFSVLTLDFPGANSPAPGIPLDRSPEELMKYLRENGVSYVVAQSPSSARSIYFRHPAHQLSTSDWFNYRSTGRAIIKWDDLLVTTLKDGHYKTEFFGTYVVISTKKNINTSSN